jgi:hypothetical protein
MTASLMFTGDPAAMKATLAQVSLIQRQLNRAIDSLEGEKSDDFHPQCEMSAGEYKAYYLGQSTVLDCMFESICDNWDRDTSDAMYARLLRLRDLIRRL